MRACSSVMKDCQAGNSLGSHTSRTNRRRLVLGPEAALERVHAVEGGHPVVRGAVHVDLLPRVGVHRCRERLEVGVGGCVEVDRDVCVGDALVLHDGALVGADLRLDVGLEVDHGVVALVAELVELLDVDDPRGGEPLVDPPEVVALVDAHGCATSGRCRCVAVGSRR